MDVARPYSAICSPLEGAVLAVLSGTVRPLTGREIARLAGRSSHSGALAALNRLAEHGLVDRQEAGRALLYTLNRQHLAAPAVEILTDMREALFHRIRDAVAGWTIEPAHLSVFGSAARGDGDVHSDVDIFLVRSDRTDEEDPAWLAQHSELAARIQRWTGNHAAIAEVSSSDISRLRDQQPPIVTELRRDAVVLAGPPIAALLGTGA